MSLKNSYCQPVASVPSAIEASRNKLKVAKNDYERAELYLVLANRYAAINQDSSIYFAEKGITIAQKLPNKKLLILLYGELGESYESIGKTAQGLRLLNKAEELGKLYKQDSVTSSIRLQLATSYTRQGNHELALQKALLALRYHEKRDSTNNVLMGTIYNALGIINTNLQRYPQAIYFFDKQKIIGKKIYNRNYLYRASVNVSDVYIKLGDYKKAEDAAQQALLWARELKNKRAISFGLGQLGEIMYKTRHYQEAIDYQKQSLLLRQEVADKRLVGISLTSLAEVYQALNQYPDALSYARQGVTTLRMTNDKVSTQLALEIQAQVLEKMANYSEALQTYKAAKLLHDSLTSIDREREVNRIQAAFDQERQQNQIQLLNQNLAIQKLQSSHRQKQVEVLSQAKRASDLQNQLLNKEKLLNLSQINFQNSTAKRQQIRILNQQQELRFANQQRLLYLTILVLLIGIITLISFFLRRQQIARDRLASQKEEIQQQAQKLAELNADKDKLFSLIGHDLRSPVASLKIGFRQLHQQVPFLPVPLQQVTSQLEQQVDRLLNLLTNLLDWSQTQLKGFQSLKRPIALRDILDESVYQLADHIRQKQLVLLNQVEPGIYVSADKHQLDAILRNLLSNAIKFTPPQGYIRLQTQLIQEQVDLKIQDTGIGMTDQQMAQLLTDPVVRTGTQGELSTGLGLRLCRELVAHQHGSLLFESHPERGTTVRLRLNVVHLSKAV